MMTFGSDGLLSTAQVQTDSFIQNDFRQNVKTGKAKITEQKKEASEFEEVCPVVFFKPDGNSDEVCDRFSKVKLPPIVDSYLHPLIGQHVSESIPLSRWLVWINTGFCHCVGNIFFGWAPHRINWVGGIWQKDRFFSWISFEDLKVNCPCGSFTGFAKTRKFASLWKWTHHHQATVCPG